MNVAVDMSQTAMPSLSPLQHEMLRVLNEEAHERNAARELCVDVSELRVQVRQLARRLNLPEQATPEKEYTQLAREAARFAAQQAKPAKGPHALAQFDDSVAWAQKLREIATAMQKGVLVTVDPYLIRPMRGQPRDYFPEEEQDSLENSLGHVGQIQDIIIRKKAPPGLRTDAVRVSPEHEDRVWRIANTQYEICDGERRWRGSMRKGLTETRAKLIEIDDEGAYLVAAVSNFNRVGHTTLERARNIDRLLKGNPPLPMEVICTLQGISKTTAEKLLQTLKLPDDIQEMMNPERQRLIGQEVLGKVPSYEVARLAGNPVLHEHARDIASRYVSGRIKLPELRAEVDRVLSRSDGAQSKLGERQQPARRLKYTEARIVNALEALRDAKARLADMKKERVLPETAADLGVDLRRIIELARESMKVIGVKEE